MGSLEMPPLLPCLVTPQWVAAASSALTSLDPSSTFPELLQEAAVLEKLMYKNINQHRGTRPFHRLAQVRRLLRLLCTGEITTVAQTLRDAVALAARPTITLHERNVPTTTAAESALRRLLGACHVAQALAEAILPAAHEFTTQLAQSFFMPLSLTCVSLLARIRVLTAQILLDSVRCYNAIAELSELLPVDSGSEAERGIASLPQMLRCSWTSGEGLPTLETTPWVKSEGNVGGARAAALGLKAVRDYLPPRVTRVSSVAKKVGVRGGTEEHAIGPSKVGARQEADAASGDSDGVTHMDVDGALIGPAQLQHGSALAVIEDRGVAISREDHMAELRVAATAVATLTDATTTMGMPLVDAAVYDRTSIAPLLALDQGKQQRTRGKKNTLGLTKLPLVASRQAEGKPMMERKDEEAGTAMEVGIPAFTSTVVKSALPLLPVRSTAFISVDGMAASRQQNTNTTSSTDKESRERGDRSTTRVATKVEEQGKSWEDWLTLPSKTKEQQSSGGWGQGGGGKKKRRKK